MIMNSNLKTIYKLVLVDNTKLKRFLLNWYEYTKEWRACNGADISYREDKMDTVCFIEAYGSGK